VIHLPLISLQDPMMQGGPDDKTLVMHC